MRIRDRSEPRDGYAVRVLAVHTTEGTSYTAAGLRDAAWWAGSSHAITDATGTLLTPAQGCVPYERASWTLRSGNRWSENIELCAMASWTRVQWLARPELLDACARWLADRSKARGIPLVKLSPKEYRAGRSGVIGHHDHTVGYSDGTHWDPGPGFPWDVVLDNARAYAAGANPGGFLMALTDTEQQVILDAAKRINGRDHQRWITGGPDLASLRVLEAWEEGAWPARSADVGDIIGLLRAVASGDARLLDEVFSEFQREADRDAANQAALAGQLAAVGPDPAVLAVALKSALGEELAADVAARLTVSAKPA